MKIVTFLYIFSLFVILTPKLFFNFGIKNQWVEILIHAIIFTVIVGISYGFVKSKLYEGAIINVEFDYPSYKGLGMNQTTNVYQTATKTDQTFSNNNKNNDEINNSPTVSPQSDEIYDNTDPVLLARQTSTTPLVNFTNPPQTITKENPYKLNENDPENDNYMDSSLINDTLKYDGFYYFMMKWPKTSSLQYQSVVWRQRDDPFILTDSNITNSNGAPGFRQFLPIQSSTSVEISNGEIFNGLKFDGIKSILSRANKQNTSNNYEQIGTINIESYAGVLSEFSGPNGIPVTQTELYIFKPNNTFQNFIDSITGTNTIIPIESVDVVQEGKSPIAAEVADPSDSNLYNFDFTKLGVYKSAKDATTAVDENDYTIDGCNLKCNDENSTSFGLQNVLTDKKFGKCFCYNETTNINHSEYISESNQCSDSYKNDPYGSADCKTVYRSRQFGENDLTTVNVVESNENTLVTEGSFSDISKIGNLPINSIENANSNKKINFSNTIDEVGGKLTTNRTDDYHNRVNPRNPRQGWGQTLEFSALK